MINKIIFISILLRFSIVSLISAQEIKTKNYFDDLSIKERKVIVEKGTEQAWTGEYNKFFEKGLYVCRACNNPLYNSNSKFRSNCGWPSFDDEIKGAVIRIPDYSLGMKRVEICCSNCKGHLGHVFEGERLTEKNIRHCVNSVSIRFIVK
ncbi:MAG: methionine-R-sulfoxide reductase [Flavobacteriales bacterium]|nr:methionine-R-sulfoxide reductase [Flavobacteriales bacterium]